MYAAAFTGLYVQVHILAAVAASYLFACCCLSLGTEKKRSLLPFEFLSAGPFILDFSRAGSSVVLFKLIALTPVCQFSSLRLLFVVCWCSREYSR